MIRCLVLEELDNKLKQTHEVLQKRRREPDLLGTLVLAGTCRAVSMLAAAAKGSPVSTFGQKHQNFGATFTKGAETGRTRPVGPRSRAWPESPGPSSKL